MLEMRAAKYNHILPISEQIISFGIGIEELLAFHAAATERLGRIIYR